MSVMIFDPELETTAEDDPRADLRELLERIAEREGEDWDDLQRRLFRAIMDDAALWERAARFLLWDMCRVLIRDRTSQERRNIRRTIEQRAPLPVLEAGEGTETGGTLVPGRAVSPSLPLPPGQEVAGEGTPCGVSPTTTLSPPPLTVRQEQMRATMEAPPVHREVAALLRIVTQNGKAIEDSTGAELRAISLTYLARGSTNLRMGVFIGKIAAALPSDQTLRQAALPIEQLVRFDMEARLGVRQMLGRGVAAIGTP